MPYSTHWPQHIQFGCHSLEQLPNFLETLPRPVVAVVDHSVRAALEPYLTVAGQTCVLLENTTVDPSWDAVWDLQRRVEEFRPRTLIGAGGGSTLDVVKAVAHVAPQLAWADVRGVDRIAHWPGKMTSVLIPTTAGTGSEVSPSIVLADPELNKAAATSVHLVADVAWIDPLLILSAPVNVTRDSGIDALTHCVEAYLGRGHNTLSDALALKGLQLISQHLPRLTSGVRDEDTAEAVAQGSLLGGLAFSVAGLGAIHGLSYTLSHRYGLSHGRANALLLGPVLAFNEQAEPDRTAEILRCLPDAATPLQRVRTWLQTVGVSPMLPDYGGTWQDRDELSHDGYRVGQRLFGNNARPVTPANVQTIIENLFNE